MDTISTTLPMISLPSSDWMLIVWEEEIQLKEESQAYQSSSSPMTRTTQKDLRSSRPLISTTATPCS